LQESRAGTARRGDLYRIVACIDAAKISFWESLPREAEHSPDTASRIKKKKVWRNRLDGSGYMLPKRLIPPIVILD